METEAPKEREAYESRWVAIQKKTFANWCNEQLSPGGRYVEDLEKDLCDGVKLVALIESLQFRKIGRVYSKPTSRIQMLQNVSLALQAITEDHVKLVNIGTEDIVNGSAKLILGLLWHLILRYQISTSKSKAPPKKLMLEWFQCVLPDLTLNNFTSDWSNGIGLCALVNYCKPGACPDWKNLSPGNGVENCRRAMQAAKEQLNVPRVIAPEDFASKELDELSAMTYLSYFIRRDSPGYYATLNWVCRCLKTTNISNLTTDWNDGYYLCAVVHSLGGSVEGWPNLDRSKKLDNCQKGLEAARRLGVEPPLTAAELCETQVDHLSVMALLSKFMNLTPPIPNPDKLTLSCGLADVMQGAECRFFVTAVDKSVDKIKVKVRVEGPGDRCECSATWTDTKADCRFTPKAAGNYAISVTYEDEEIVGSPVALSVIRDISKVKVLTPSGQCKVGSEFMIKVDKGDVEGGHFVLEATSDKGQTETLSARTEGRTLLAPFRPSSSGNWTVRVYLDGSAAGSVVKVTAFDPSKAALSAPETGVVGEMIVCQVVYREPVAEEITAQVESDEAGLAGDVVVLRDAGGSKIRFQPSKSGTYRIKALLKGENITGSPVSVNVLDPGQLRAFGEGLKRAVRGEEASFVVQGAENGHDLSATVENDGQQIAVRRFSLDAVSSEFRYIPRKPGFYLINVVWKGKALKGSPWTARVTDRGLVSLLDDLTDRRDERDYLVLPYDQPSTLNFDISRAGPGTLTAEVLGPQGKLAVHVNQTKDRAVVSFKALYEGNHYIHLYWAEAPLELSPMLGYCQGPPLPVDAGKVILTGQGAVFARATVQAEFIIDGRKAGPGEVFVEMKGVKSALPVDIHPMTYDRYRCTYTPPLPGGFLLYVYWSGMLVPGCPHKITVTAKGDVRKVKVTGEGLRGGVAGHELKVFVDTKEAGPGEITATCTNNRQGSKVTVHQNEAHHYTLRVVPTLVDKHHLAVMYDGEHVPGSPFTLRIGEPPDPSKVRVFGPGIEDGMLYSFQSTFLVDTHGAGAGQLAVRIRGPKESFKVDMHRENNNERIIKCKYNPTEPGDYVITVRWSNDYVPGSPFNVTIVETQEALEAILQQKGISHVTNGSMWRAEI